MKLRLYTYILFSICSVSVLAQIDTLNIDPKINPAKSNPTDSIPIVAEEQPQIAPSRIDVPISDDSFEGVITYGADDIQWVDVNAEEVHLKGNAFVKYEDAEIKAGYIIFKIKENEALAQQLESDDKSDKGLPTFIQDGQTVEYKKLRYNFKTEQGIVYGAISRQSEFYVHGAVTKFVKQNPDSLVFDDAIYNKNALITTCDHEHPHYGIRTSKLKIIPDKLAIIGPSRLEIAGVPTPIFFPFAFAPLFTTPSGRSGIVFGGTQGFEFSPTLGIGFREVGYHFALSDYMNLTVTGDIYTRGTWRLRVGSEYNRRYKYSGSVQLGFSNELQLAQGAIEPNVNRRFSFQLRHNQDAKAHPYVKIGGNFTFTTNDYNRNVFNDASAQLENVINSNLTYSNTLPGLKNFTLTASLAHSQNTLTRAISFTLPDLNFRSTTMYPFKGKGPGNEKWYEKINVRYNSRFRNYVSTQDTILFTQETLDKLQTGMSHEATAGASFSFFKYINFTPSVSYREFWFVKTLERQFDPNAIVNIDETFNDVGAIVDQDTTFGDFIDEFNFGLRRFSSLTSSFNLSTNVFNTWQKSKGWLRGIRHTMKPQIGFSFSPDTERFREFILDTETNESYVDTLTGEFVEYNPFAGGVFSVPSLRERQMAITYSLNNIFEAKRWSKKDSTEKKFKLFDNLRFSGSYNFAADSLKWSIVNANGTARFFDNITTLNLSATFDPYIKQNGRRVNITQLSQEGRLLRFDNFRATLATRFTIGKIREIFGGEGDDENDRKREARDRKKEFMGESIWDLIDNFSVTHTFSYGISTENDGTKSPEVSAHSIRMQGSFALTDKWNVDIRNFSYDFKNNRFVYPELGLSRDLHCWQMQFRWQPARGTYLFNIGVKTSELSNFLKYDYSKNQFDSRI